jgi:hypothetical protein
VVEGVVCVQKVVSSKPIIDNLWKIAEKNVHASPNKFFFLFLLFGFFKFTFCRVLLFAEWFWHSAKPLPSARQKAFGKDVFTDEIAAECPLPSVIRALPSVIGKGPESGSVSSVTNCVAV